MPFQNVQTIKRIVFLIDPNAIQEYKVGYKDGSKIINVYSIFATKATDQGPIPSYTR